MGERPPEWIVKAARAAAAGDDKAREALRIAGLKGSSHRTQNADFKKAVGAEELARLTADQAKLYTLSEEGDVLPPEEIVPLEG